jgi:hypothetical protein
MIARPPGDPRLSFACPVRRPGAQAVAATLTPGAGKPDAFARVEAFRAREDSPMNALLALLIWCLLFAVSWPLALLALLLWPMVWLLSLPLRLVGIGLGAGFALVRAVLFLPARLLGAKP